MHILTRYIFKQVFLMFLMVSVIIIGILWIVQSLKFVELALNSHASLRLFFKFTFLLLPDLLMIIFPISGFIGVLFVLHKLRTERELVIMKASGYSEWKIACPILSFGFLISLILYGVSIFVLPKSFEKLRDLELALKNSLPAVLIQEGVFKTIKGTTIYVRQKEGHNRLKGIFAHVADSNFKHAYALMAKEGRLVDMPQGPQVLMVEGNRQQLTSDQHSLSLLYFDRTLISLSPPSRIPSARTKKPHELPLKELLFPDKKKYTSAERQRLRAEGYQRLLNPLLAVTYVIIAATFLLRGGFKRQNHTWSILYAGTSVLTLQGVILMLMNLSARFQSMTLVGIFIVGGVIVFGCYSLYTSKFEYAIDRVKKKINYYIPMNKDI